MAPQDFMPENTFGLCPLHSGSSLLDCPVGAQVSLGVAQITSPEGAGAGP